MSASNKRPVAGSRSQVRAKTSTDAARCIRMGLLGSTALIAASFAASGAMAQSYPVGGGTIVVTGGATTDETGAGGGFQNVGGNGYTITDVTLTNTTGSPTAHAIDLTRSSFSGSGDGFGLFGTNNLTAATGGTALRFVSTGGNNTGIGFNGVLNATGLNGVSVTSLGEIYHSGSAVINLTALSAGSGTGLMLSAGGGIGDTGFTGAFSATNFATGISLNATNGYIAFQTGAGGAITGATTGVTATANTGVGLNIGSSINATTTGISASSNSGTASVTATAAIVAATGIRITGSSSQTVITSGGGTLNAQSAGVGTGISTTTNGSGAVNLSVGASIGATTAFANGVVVANTNPSTAVVNFQNTASITASTASSTNSGVSLTVWSPAGRNSVTVGADITGGRGVHTSGGAWDFNVQSGATITAGAANGHGINSGNSTSILTNAGVIRALGAGGHGADLSGIQSVTNSGTIQGAASGIRLLNNTTINNTGTISGGTAGGIHGSGATINNTGGTISGNQGIVGTSNPNNITNSAGGLITGVVDAINVTGNAWGFLNNSATVNTGGGAGSHAGVYLNRSSANAFTITNTGTITGGADSTLGWAINVEDGGITITNNSGGQINSLSGLAGGNAIMLLSDDLATLNLNLGSTVNGTIVSGLTGARTVTLAGSVTGDYDAGGGGGVDTFTLASTGSIGGDVNLGGGDDTFTWQGGTIGGSIDGGMFGADIFTSVLGAGNSNSLNLGDLTDFETYRHQSGTLTLTGSRDGDAGWYVYSPAILTLSGSLTNVTGVSGDAISAEAGATVNVLGTGVLSGATAVLFNGAGTGTLNNAGAMSATNFVVGAISGTRINLTNSVGGSITSSTGAGVALTTGGGTIINNGSINAATNALTSANTGTGGSASSLTNAGSLDGIDGGLVMTGTGAFTATNTGSINGSAVNTGVGVYQSAGTLTVANNSGGTISGNGYAIQTIAGSLALTNASGASINGGSVAAIHAHTTGTVTLDLQAGSTTVGDVFLSGTGARTVTLAGAMNGMLYGSGNSGAINLTVNTSASGYVLLVGGSGADTITFTGAGSRTFSVDNLTSWDTGAFTGGNWTLTGTGNGSSFVSGLSITGGGALSISNSQQLQGSTLLTMNNGSITTTASMTNSRAINLTGTGGLGVASGQTLTQSGVISGAGALTLTGPGTLVLSGNNTYTGGTVVNSGILRLDHTSAAGTGVIRLIDPQINFNVAGTYNNNISLEVVNGQQAADPTILNNTSGVAITLAGRIYETGGVGGANQYVTFSGVGGTTLTNAANSWGGVTTINSGTVLFGNSSSISGGSIVNNGSLRYSQANSGTVAQAISGSGGIVVSGLGVGQTLTFGGALTTSNGINITDGSSVTLAGGFANNGNGPAVSVGGMGSTVTNLGAINVPNSSFPGTIIFNNGGTFINGAVGNTTASLNGAYAGVYSTNELLTVTNYGAITAGGYAIVAQAGSPNSRLVLTNSGTLTAGDATVVSNQAGVVNSITNTGTITGSNNTFTGISIAGGGTITNSGDIYGGTNSGYSAISSTGAGLTITNQAGGVILGYNGITRSGASGAVNNSGVIRGIGTTAVTFAAANTVTNNAGGVIAGQTDGLFVYGGINAVTNNGVIAGINNGISGASAAHSITNAGVIVAGSVTDATTTLAQADRNSASISAFGVNFTSSGTVTNLAGGSIAGRAAGIRLNSGGTVTNAGLIDSNGVAANDAGVLLSLGGTVNNQTGGTIQGAIFGVRSSSGALSLTNAGTITGAQEGVSSVGALTMTNTGSVTGNLFSGVTFRGTGSLDNYGSITGSASWYGVQNASASGTTTITNRSGGSITGASGGILIDGAGATVIDLQAGSTTGRIVTTSTGARTVTVAGTMTHDYSSGSNNGVDAMTLASTGSMTNAFLGGGNDTFTYQGGAFSGSIDGGGATDSFISALGAGSGSVDLGYVTNFETFTHQSGTLTTTGTGNFSGGASITGGSLIVNGTLNGDTNVASGGALSGGGTINGLVTVANGGALANTQGSTLTMDALLLNSGSAINATFSGAAGTALFDVVGNLTLDGTVNVASTGAYGFGVYGLMTYGGILTDNGLLIGTTPGTAQRMSVQTSVAGQINIVHAPNELLFWDGGNGGQHDNGAVNGGAGVWTSTGSEWTDSSGLFNGAMNPQPGFAIFQGSAGTVTVDNSLGAISVTGMQFAANGYRIEGDPITLADPSTIIRVGDGTAPGAGWTATIASDLIGAGGLVKTDLGTLILTGDSNYGGGTTVNAGVLQIGDGATAGTITGAVALAGGSVTFARNDDHDFSNAVSGNGTVNVSGVVTLSGPITATNGVGVGAGSTATLSSVNVVNGNAVFAGLNGTVNVVAGGLIQSQNGTGVFLTGANGTVDNAGAIIAGTNTVFANGNLILTNQASGTINGVFAVTALQNLNLNNAGTITATNTAFNSSGIYVGGSGLIDNSGTITSNSNVIYTQGAGTLTNSGLIQGGGAASAVRLVGAGSSIDNLTGGQIIAAGTGVGLYLDGAGASVSNAGLIQGSNAISLVSGGTVTNSGTLTGNTNSGTAGNNMTVQNLTGGSISGAVNGLNFVSGGGMLANDGDITGTTGQGVLLQTGGTVINTGSITGGQSGVRSQAGLILASSGSISGSVNAIESVGVFSDSLTLQAGSITTGAILTNGGNDTISLAGALNGLLNAGDDADTVTLFDTASFSSTLDGGLGVDAFILDGAGAGSLDIGNVLNFESRAMNGAGVWTLTGTDASTAAWAINSGTLAVDGGAAINDAVLVAIAAGGTLQLDADEQIGAISGSGSVALGSSTLTIGGAGASSFAGVIDGAGGLTVAGGGVLTLSGANTFTGDTVASGGTLRLGASDVLSDLTDLYAELGGVIDMGAFDDTVANALFGAGTRLDGTGTLTAGVYLSEGATFNANLGGGLFYAVDGTTILNGTVGADVALMGGDLTLGASDRIADTALVSLEAGDTLDLGAFNDTILALGLAGTLNGTGTLTAQAYVLDGGTVNANLGSGLLVNIDGVSTLNGVAGVDLVGILDGTLTLGASERIINTADLQILSGGTFDLGAFNETVRVTEINGTLAGTGTLTALQHQLDGATVNANVTGDSLYVVGAASTLNGFANVNLLSVLSGSLTLGASNRIDDGATLGVSNGATLDIGAFNERVAVAALAGTLDGAGTLVAGQYELDGATVNANLGAGALFNTGGVSTLNGTSGAANVLVQAGTLAFGASNLLADNATVSVASGSTLNLNAFNDTVDLALLNGALAGTGTLTAAHYQLNGATINANLGAGNLFNTGGVSTLNGVSGASLVSVQGGTLNLGASDRLADDATVSVASGRTLSLGAFNETVRVAVLNGVLAGTGTLTAGEYDLNGATVNANLGAGILFNLGGISTLNGASGAANVVVQAGTLALGASDRLADTASVSVGAGSILNLNAFNDTVGLAHINGTLAGTGTLTATQYQLNGATVNANLAAGTLFNLGGVSTLNGTAAASQVQINAGTMRLGDNERLSDTAVVSVASGATFNVNGFNERIGALFGTGDVTVGAGRLTFGGVESGFGGRLTGSGSLVHTGGLFTLLGDHTITSMSNTGGEFRFLGTTTGSLTASGGSITGAGTIGGALAVSNGAVLSPGLAGVQNGVGGFIAGGLTLNGGTLAIDVLGKSGGNLIDQLRINGAANLTGGLLTPNFQGPVADFDFSTRYLFLQANSLTGTFANGSAFTASAKEGLFWRVRYDLAPNAAVLELRQLTNFDPGATGTDNQRSVGQALSGGQLAASDDWTGVLTLIAGLTPAQRAAAFDSISGEPLADVTTSMFSANDTFLTAVRDGGMGGRNDGGEALNFVDSLSFVGGRETGADRLGDVLGAFDPSASTGRGAGGWVSAYSGDQTLDGKPGQATVESTLNGFAGGYGVTNGAMSLGGAAGVTRLEGDVVARQGHYESDLSHAAGYVAFDDGVWAADVSASFYGGDLDTRRGLTVGAFTGTAIGNTHIEGQSISASVARRFQLTENTMVALGAIGTASNASVDGYTETGAGGLSLQASGQERDWQSLQFSARGVQDYLVNGRGFRIYGGAGVMAITGDRQATGDMRFTGAPIGFGTFTVEGAEAPPTAGLVDFGLEVGAGQGVTVSAGYRGLFSERLQDNQVGVKLQVSW